MERKRSSGILMHISSLPGEYGIGDFGKEAYSFVDFLADAKQKYWQVLPLGITGYGDSPYQSFSSYAGNPYFIELDEFIERGYLTKDEINSIDLGCDVTRVDYGLLYRNKMHLLEKAYEKAKEDLKEDLYRFYWDNNEWLKEFALFMSIKKHHGNVSWLIWQEEYRRKDSKVVEKFEIENIDRIYFWTFTQYFFYKQWYRLKSYANVKGVRIIGDLPIYVAEDSQDVWSNPRLFNLDEDLLPITVSGCPPDAFSRKGQLWGNPIYNWSEMEKDNYRWWKNRIKHSFEIFDVLRIDHFRGFEAYWEIKYGFEDAVIGHWVKGPGTDFFNSIKEELGELNIIAEDLGFLTEDVKKLLKYSGFPGMKVLQFAFDSREESDYLPHNYDKNCVVYTGTHDNSTVEGWFLNAGIEDVDYAKKYLKLDSKEGLNWGFIRGAWSSAAGLAITTMQDILGLGDEARMNTPATVNGNWTWRMKKTDLTDEMINNLAAITAIYRR
ncbi:MAG TPA: 4-alpha-glucanotransferase [Sedimentibacter sp.]|nr:4-alpha-glucanotransferase [Sedimentibacter sp.]HNZ82227.1 4-alpha-glucanotransferase [Sedimentibacter sp.]HOH68855.1 4-alpha-glucanotransferase [Sedimentibacter sp.]HPX00090.1 4-alpha-glucanotransferase [Sedimentibacter sp.]HQB63500.1 4-alpha-glucanotransferase [Sedimentibacter sp.]